MPEGDSYTKAAQRIRPVLVGHPVDEVDGSAPDVRRHSSRLVGSTTQGVRTLGKHLLIDLDSDLTVHIHLGMPGRVLVQHRALSGHGLRASFATSTGIVGVVAAPTVEVDSPARIESGLAHLGPDVLAEAFDEEAFQVRAMAYPDAALVSDFLLDQRVMAGVGNVYKCEVLFLERVHPSTPMADVDPDRRLALARRSRRIMVPNALRSVRNTTGLPGRESWVYGRAGRACRRCRTAIESAWIGGDERITYWCPSCQV